MALPDPSNRTLALLAGLAALSVLGSGSWWFFNQQSETPGVAAPGRAPANASPPTAATGAPIAVTISTRNCQWGADFDAYFQQALALQGQADPGPGGLRPQVVIRVPGRTWQGLTIGGVAAMPTGAAIIFAQPPTQVRDAFVRAGIAVATNGVIGLTEIEAEGSDRITQALRAVDGSTARYGATMLYCGER